MFLTEVFNTETWKAVAEQHSRAYACVGDSFSPKNLQILNSKLSEVDDLVFNTQVRKDAKDRAYKFTTSYALPSANFCDIDLNSL
jgi:hypothetical protein